MTPQALLDDLGRTEFTGDVEAFFDADAIHMVEEEISLARTSIDLEVFMLGGPLGERVLRLLDQKARAGVRVRLIHAEGLSIRVGVAVKSLMLLCAGRRVDPCRDHVPVARRLFGRDLARSPIEWARFPLSAFPGALTAPLQLAHDKLVLVDGDCAMTGGMNLSTATSNNHDLLLRIRGSAVAGMQLLFDYDFWLARGLRSELPTLRPAPDSLATNALATSSVQYLFTRPHGARALDVLVDVLRAARKRVWVEMFYVTEPRTIAALGDACSRGLDVRVICDPNEYSLGLRLRGAPNLPYARHLERLGVPVRLFQTRPGSQMHQKSLIIDDDLAVAGSTNLTRQSFRVNTESAAIVRGTALVRALEGRFLEDWRQSKAPHPSIYRQRRLYFLIVHALGRYV
jgi:phosphatidylserine/phosphatidylglycerophosphate/cardiolipin synthase-like enzyme